MYPRWAFNPGEAGFLVPQLEVPISKVNFVSYFLLLNLCPCIPSGFFDTQTPYLVPESVAVSIVTFQAMQTLLQAGFHIR